MKTVPLLVNITRSPVTGMSFPLPTNVPLQTNSTELTSFRNDFKRPEPRRPPRPLPPPEPAVQFFDCGSHIAAATTDNYISTSQLSFALPQLPHSNHHTIHRAGNSSYCTNFKMDADWRLKGHETTTQYEFSSKPLEPLSREYARSVLKLSQPGSLGNRASGSLEIGSEYRQSFAATPAIKDGHQLEKIHRCTDPMTGKHFSSNGRSFVTTTMVTYRGEPKQVKTTVPYTVELQQAGLSSIPFGDTLKMAASESATRYTPPARFQHLQHSKTQVNRTIHTSSVLLQNNRNTPPTTTMEAMYTFHKAADQIHIDHCERNTSFLPEGDLDKERVKDRLSDVTSRKMHPKPSLDCYPKHIDGSKLHTLSHVPLNSCAMDTHPLAHSTLSDSYKPVSIKVKHVRAPAKDNIPFDYYSGHLCCSTARDSYQARLSKGVHKLNSQAMLNLKKSHWEFPDMTEPSFLTSQRKHFTTLAS